MEIFASMFRYLKWPVLKQQDLEEGVECGEMHQTGKSSPRKVIHSTPDSSDLGIYEIRNKVIHTKGKQECL